MEPTDPTPAESGQSQRKKRKDPTTQRISKGLRVFRTSYRDAGGVTQLASKWYIEFRDADRIVRRLPAFPDKGQSVELARKVQRLVSWKVAGELPDPTLTQWLEQMPRNLRERLAGWGLIDERRIAAAKPLSDHLNDYEAYLKARGRNSSYIAQSKQQIQRIIDACKWKSWSDVRASDVDGFLNELRDGGVPEPMADKPKEGEDEEPARTAADRTVNSYLIAAKAFTRWMVKDRRATESPLAHLAKIDETPSYERGAFTLDETRRLLAAAKSGTAMFGMSGEGRALLYRVAVETGFRAGELRQLTVDRLELEGDRPTATAVRWTTKGGKARTVRLRIDTAAELRTHVTHKLPAALVFNIPPSTHTAEMLYADLEAAQPPIPRIDASGKIRSFHSLRHTLGSFFNAAGVNPKVAQAVLGHSDINLTMGIYTHTYRDDEAAAVAALPDLSTPSAMQTAKATGTDPTISIGQPPSAIGQQLAGSLARRLAHSGAGNGTTRSRDDISSPVPMQISRDAETAEKTAEDEGIGRGRIRTYEGVSHQIYSLILRDTRTGEEITYDTPPENLASCLAHLSETNPIFVTPLDADLRRLIERWDTLPPDVRTRIIELLNV